MPNYFARKAGNINDNDVWATTPAGTAGPVTFVAGDVLYANSFAITVNVSTNLGSTGEVRNDNTNSATAGGTFTLSNGVTLTANVITGSAANCVTYAGTSGNSATIIGNVAGGIGGGRAGASNTSSGTLNITGNCTAGNIDGAFGANNASTGTLNITGNCTGGSIQNNTAGARNASTGTVNITGNCVGGASFGTTANGAINLSTGTINITGNCIGGSGGGGQAGVNNNSTGIINIIGDCVGGTNAAAPGARNSSTGLLSITGNCTGSSTTAAVGAENASTGQMIVNGSIFASEQASGVGGGVRGQVTRLTGPFYTSPIFGVNPVTCLSWRWASTLNPNTFIEVPTTNLTSTRNFVTPDNATNFPAAIHVRNGTTYGISGDLVGSCFVPPSGSVRLGVPVDNTTGSAILDAADIWNYMVSNLTTSGSIGARLKNTATTQSVGDIFSAQGG